VAEVERLVDGLGLFLSGGASNVNPDLSLGGVGSSARVYGLGAILSDVIPAIRIDNVFPACGEGTAYLTVDPNGDIFFTPPSGLVFVEVTKPQGVALG